MAAAPASSSSSHPATSSGSRELLQNTEPGLAGSHEGLRNAERIVQVPEPPSAPLNRTPQLQPAPRARSRQAPLSPAAQATVSRSRQVPLCPRRTAAQASDMTGLHHHPRAGLRQVREEERQFQPPAGRAIDARGSTSRAATSIHHIARRCSGCTYLCTVRTPAGRSQCTRTPTWSLVSGRWDIRYLEDPVHHNRTRDGLGIAPPGATRPAPGAPDQASSLG